MNINGLKNDAPIVTDCPNTCATGKFEYGGVMWWAEKKSLTQKRDTMYTSIWSIPGDYIANHH